MAINVTAIRDLLVPGLRGITGEYKQWPAIWPKLFDQGKSEMAQERTPSMRFLPLAQLKTDGGQTSFDNASGEAFIYNQLHVGIGLGYEFRREYGGYTPDAIALATFKDPFGAVRFVDSDYGSAATKGSFNTVDISAATTSIGSSASFLRYFVQNSTYTPLSRNWNFARALRIGCMCGAPKETPAGK